MFHVKNRKSSAGHPTWRIDWPAGVSASWWIIRHRGTDKKRRKSEPGTVETAPGFRYPKIAHEVVLLRAVFILEVYAYLVVAVTLKKRSLRLPGVCAYPESALTRSLRLPGPAMLVTWNVLFVSPQLNP